MNMTSLTCAICKKDFSKRSNLRAHVKKFHPGKLEELSPKKNVKSAAICEICSTSFTKKSNLTRHIKKFHKDEQHKLLKPKTYAHECNICHKHFTYLRHLKYHMKCHNNQDDSEVVKNLKCILCASNGETESFQKSDLFVHFEKRHDIKLVTDTLQFSSFKDFEDWKRQEENRIHESFVKSYTHKTQNLIRTRYVCHRSGTYKSKGSGMRRLKRQGSKKINGFCPAEMRLKIIDGKCNLKYIKTHVGHTSDLVHLNLTETERQSLAAQIASQVPFEKILDQVRQSKCNGTLERSHLLKRKDLHNIKQSLNISKEPVRRGSDASSVDACVTEMDSGENEEELKIVNTLPPIIEKSTNEEEELQLEKDKIKRSLTSIIDKISSFQELDTVRRLIASIESTLTATGQEKSMKLANKTTSVPHKINTAQRCQKIHTKHSTAARIQLKKNYLIQMRYLNEIATNTNV